MHGGGREVERDHSVGMMEDRRAGESEGMLERGGKYYQKEANEDWIRKRRNRNLRRDRKE